MAHSSSQLFQFFLQKKHTPAQLTKYWMGFSARPCARRVPNTPKSSFLLVQLRCEMIGVFFSGAEPVELNGALWDFAESPQELRQLYKLSIQRQPLMDFSLKAPTPARITTQVYQAAVWHPWATVKDTAWCHPTVWNEGRASTCAKCVFWHKTCFSATSLGLHCIVVPEPKEIFGSGTIEEWLFYLEHLDVVTWILKYPWGALLTPIRGMGH